MKETLLKVAAVTAIAAGTAFAAISVDTVQNAQALQERPAALVASRGAEAAPGALSAAFRAATNRALPAVVHVQVEAEGQVVRDLFGRRVQAPAQRGAGSGFVIRPDGYILTNNHVIEDATRVTVVTQERQEYDATVVGRDPNTDLAVLKIEAKNLPVASLGNSDAAAVGDWAVALGYPLQLGVTATAGIVSAKGRAIGIIDRTEDAPAPLEYFIQTDAAINPGNSGGPLVDLEGRVIGVNSAIKSQTGFYSGYGFAIPISLARRVADDLIAHGHVRRPRLGIQLSEIDPVDVEVYGLPRAAGAEVVMVEDGSPAAQAGLRMGDVITALNGQPLEAGGDLTERIALLEPGTRVTLDLIRYGKQQRVSVELGEFPTPHVDRRTAANREADGVARLGFSVMNMTPQVARRLEYPDAEGVIIQSIAAGSSAQRAGLQEGWVIESLNGTRIENTRDLERAASELRAGGAVSVIVRDATGARRIFNYRVRG